MEEITVAFQRIASFLSIEKDREMSRTTYICQSMVDNCSAQNAPSDAQLHDKTSYSSNKVDLYDILKNLNDVLKNVSFDQKMSLLLEVLATLKMHDRLTPIRSDSTSTDEHAGEISPETLLKLFNAHASIDDVKNTPFEMYQNIWCIITGCAPSEALSNLHEYLCVINCFKTNIDCCETKEALSIITDRWSKIVTSIDKIIDEIQLNESELVIKYVQTAYNYLHACLSEDLETLKHILGSEWSSERRDIADLVCKLVAAWDHLSNTMRQTYENAMKHLTACKAAVPIPRSYEGSPSGDDAGNVDEENSRGFSEDEMFTSKTDDLPAPKDTRLSFTESDIEPCADSLENAQLRSPPGKFNLLQQLHEHPAVKLHVQTGMLKGLEQCLRQLSLAASPVHLDWFYRRASPTQSGCLLALLLQTSAFATSSGGSLFTLTGISILEDAQDEVQASLDPQMGLDFCFKSSFTSWMGHVFTGIGLPEPCLLASESVCDFVSFVVDTVLPIVLALMESDLQTDRQAYTSQLAGQHRCVPEDSMRSFHASPTGFKSCVLPILGKLVSFLTCGVQNSGDAPEGGITAQLTDLIIGIGELAGEEMPTGDGGTHATPPLKAVEKLASCLADCFLLRSLCQLLARLFQHKLNISAGLLNKSGKVLTGIEGDLSSELAECTKQYDSSIRVLAEHLVDLLLVLPDQLGLELLPSCLTGGALGTVCSPSFQVRCSCLFDLWDILCLRCPAGLARQILVQTAVEYLSLAVQQLATVTQLSLHTGQSTKLLNDLWLLLKTVQFVLFSTCENVFEVVASAPMTTGIDRLHSSAMLLMQILVHCLAPQTSAEPCLQSDALPGQSSSGVKEGKVFDFAISNWLCFVAPTSFTQPPVTLMQQEPRETEIHIEWTLFAISRQFAPHLLVSLITSWDFQFTLRLLSDSKLLNPPREEGVDSKMPSRTEVVDFVTAVYRICAALPDSASFFSETLCSAFQRSETRKLFSGDGFPTADIWPIWLAALMRIFDKKLSLLWPRFVQLVNFTVARDDSLTLESLSEQGNQSPKTILANHCPKPPAFWEQLFPAGKLPCNCDFPRPVTLTVHTVYETMCQSPWSGLTYTKFYDESGRIAQSWYDFTLDLLRTVVVLLPAGLHAVFSQVQELYDGGISGEGERLRFVADNFAIHLMLLYLHHKIVTLDDGKAVEITRLQRLILLQYVCNLIGSSDLFAETKQHLLASLEEAKMVNDGTTSQGSDQTDQGKTFQLTDLLHCIQYSTLAELCVVSTFLRRHAGWIYRDVICRNTCTGRSIINMNSNPTVSLPPSAINDIVPISLDDIDWKCLCSVNFGSVKSTMDLLS